MHPRLTLVPCILALFISCDRPPESIPTDATTNQPSNQEQLSTPEKFTRIIATETEYYTTGPQQGRPPDGSFQTGTKVTVVEDAGGYSLVESENGVRAYVATDSLKEPTLEDRVNELLKEGRKIEAIRVYRAETGVGLKEAKDAVEEIERRVENQ